MKFTLDRKTIIEHVLLQSPVEVAKEVAETPLWVESETVEAKLTMNGVDIPVENLEAVLKNMWEQCQEKTGVNTFKRKVREEAERIVKEKANSTLEAFSELQSKLDNANDLIKWEWDQ